jgi:hypothetical protein
MAEMAMETDGDGSGGTSLSRQGARMTSVPRNSSAAVVELRNSSRNLADCFRVFRPEASYRRRVMSTHASVLVDSVGPPSAEVCRAAASFP